MLSEVKNFFTPARTAVTGAFLAGAISLNAGAESLGKGYARMTQAQWQPGNHLVPGKNRSIANNRLELNRQLHQTQNQR